MYRSLENTCGNFHLYILAFDDLAAEVLGKMKLAHVTVITLEEFEDEELKRVKQTRTRREYCWTCSSSLILYTIEYFKLDACTYIDADLFFFDDPWILLNELGNDSVLITEHRYDPDNSKAYKLGKYCVQFNTFKNNEYGLKALRWWRDRCLEWCYAIPEDGKFGDQKYLDDWPERFKGVHELSNLGGGVAPWNVSQYEFFSRNGKIFGKILNSEKEFPLVFYHFHKTDIYKIFREIKIKSYRLINKNENLQNYIYGPYVKALASAMAEIKTVDDGFKFNFGKISKFIFETIRELA